MEPDKRNPFFKGKFTLISVACLGAILGAPSSGQADISSVNLTPSFTTTWQQPGVLWQNAQLTSPLKSLKDDTLTRREMVQSLKATLQQDPVLNELYQFRETLRGRGKMPVRRWSLGGGNAAVNLELGKHALPGLSLAGLGGSQASVGISGNGFGFFSSAPVQALNRSLASYDEFLGEKNRATEDRTEMTWLQLQPVHSKTAHLQLVWASGQKDLSPTTDKNQLLQGSLWGVQGSYELPMLSKWNLQGQWVKSNVGNSDGATAWQAKLAGPIQHPLGTAKISAVYTKVDPGFESFAGDSIEDGRTTKTLAISQPLGKGDLTAKLGLSWNQIERFGNRHLNLPRTDTTFNSIVSLRWRLASNIAITAKHSLTRNTDELYPGSKINVRDQHIQDTQAGVEIKVSSALVLNLGAGMESNLIQQQAGSRLSPTYDHSSNYLTIGMKNKTPSGSIGVDLQRSFAENGIAQNEENNVVVNLNAQQELSNWLKVGGKVRLMNECAPLPIHKLLKEPADLTANAQISLSSLGAVQLSYSQWNLKNAVNSKDTDALNAYQISYLLGARGNQSGLGLSVAYSYSAADDPQNSMWKVGFTYR